MRSLSSKILRDLFIFLCFCLVVLSMTRPVFSARVLDDSQWKKDLTFLADKISHNHRHPFDRVPEKAFWKAVEELDQQIPSLEDHEIIVGMARLASLIRDGHTRLTLPLGSQAGLKQSHTQIQAPDEAFLFHILPIEFYLFSDGLHVRAASPEYKDILGAKVIKVGAVDAEEALEAVRPVVHYDSEMWFKLVAPSMMTIPEVLHAQKLSSSKEEATFVFQTSDGQEKIYSFKPLNSRIEIQWIYANQEAKTPEPLYLRNKEKNFWYEYLLDKKIMYVQINSIQDEEGETMAEFSKRLFDAVDSLMVDKFVLDLRLNGGGDNYLSRPVVLSVIRSDKVNQFGRLFVVIGRRTFSAAMNLVTDLEKWTNAIFVGEPTGNTPSQYGDARIYVLPNSKLTVRISSVYWRDWSVSERRPWVSPDIKVELSSKEYAANVDPVLEAITSYQAPETLYGQLREKIERSGWDAASFHYYKFRYSPQTAHIRAEEDLVKLGDYLVKEEKLTEAIRVFRACIQDYSDSFKAHIGLGKVYLMKKIRKQAVETLEKALALDPESQEARELLKKAQSLN
jgi:hypothetical protein